MSDLVGVEVSCMSHNLHQPRPYSEPTQEWLADMPMDLDVCIAQRSFSAAIDLIHSAKKAIQSVFADVVNYARPYHTQRVTRK